MIDVLTIAQIVLTGGLGAWMITGVYDNLRHPVLNRASVQMVVGFDLMAEQYPEDYAQVSHRRIDNPATIKKLFYLIVVIETLAAIGLVLGTGLMIAAVFRVVPMDFARDSAMIGAIVFCANWIGFLVGGNYFAYWYCHFEAQATHFMLLLWGIGVIVLLAQG